ncbi:MAG TPA: ankyrin repeat domain-containing protein [Gammaproteobacteria bacterium]|jgi:hypothetical protein|nr:ankyrin repeat domain-containing protein [Gammaproteobacteria bacterium]
MQGKNIINIIKDKDLTDEQRLNEVNQYIKNLNDIKLLETLYDQDNMTALMAAIIHKHIDCVIAIIAANVDVNFKPEPCRLNPLHYAISYRSYDCARLLLEAKAHINEKSFDEITPLSYAAQFYRENDVQQKQCVSLLLSSKAEINLANPYDASIPQLYKILTSCDPHDYLTEPAFKQLLQINDKKKENTHSFSINRYKLNQNEIEHIKKILKKPDDKKEIMHTESENKQAEPSRCLVM